MTKAEYQLRLYWKRFVRYADYLRFLIAGKESPTDIDKTLPTREKDLPTYLDKLDRYMKSRFYYKYDNVDFAKHPYTFYDDQFGDCDDFSLWSLYCLRKAYPELESNMMIVFRENEGHAVCIVKDKDGNYHHISNWGVVSAFNDKTALALNIFPDAISWWEMNYNLTILDYKFIK